MEETRAAVVLTFVNQAAPDIRKKLHKIEGLGDQTVQDLLKLAENVSNTRETLEKWEDWLHQEDQERFNRKTEFQVKEGRR